MNSEYVLHLLAILFAMLNSILFLLLSSAVCSLRVPKHKWKFRDDLQKNY